METTLTVKKENMLSLIQGGGVAELIKPLQNEILLLETYVAGTAYIEDEVVFDEAREGDGLILRRESNRFDEKAILVLDVKERKLGYVPERENTVLSRLMDAGKFLRAKIDALSPKGSFRQVNISIYLLDF